MTRAGLTVLLQVLKWGSGSSLGGPAAHREPSLVQIVLFPAGQHEVSDRDLAKVALRRHGSVSTRTSLPEPRMELSCAY